MQFGDVPDVDDVPSDVRHGGNLAGQQAADDLGRSRPRRPQRGALHERREDGGQLEPGKVVHAIKGRSECENLVYYMPFGLIYWTLG